MTDDTPVDRLRGVRMTDTEIDAFLRRQGVGVLALADGGDAYALPISFGYDDGRLYFAYFRFADEPLKEAYSEATETACLAVYEAESTFRWRSVLASGPIEAAPREAWDEVGAAIDENAWSPDLSSIGPRRYSVGSYVLSIEEATGLKGKEAG